MAQELFDGIDINLPDEQLSEWLVWVLDKRVVVDEREVTTVSITDDETRLLRQWSREAGPKLRETAANFLFWRGPCDWDDLEVWALDEYEGLRQGLFNDLPGFTDSSIGGKLCFADKERCIRMISRAAERYPGSHGPIDALRDFAMLGDEWLELSWREANRLLEINDIDLNTELIVGYFEDLVQFLKWGPDDPHLKAWINGTDGWRQIILLRNATWLGLDEGKVRDIVTALTKAKDKEIAALAQGVLEGRVGYADL